MLAEVGVAGWGQGQAKGVRVEFGGVPGGWLPFLQGTRVCLRPWCPCTGNQEFWESLILSEDFVSPFKDLIPPLSIVYSIHITSLTISPLLHQLSSRLFFSLPVFSCLLLDFPSSSENGGSELSPAPSLITSRHSRQPSPLRVCEPSSARYKETYLPLLCRLYTGLYFSRNKLLFNSSKDFHHLNPQFCGDSHDAASKCCQLRIIGVGSYRDRVDVVSEGHL